MSEDEPNWNHEDLAYSDVDADSTGDDYGENESDDLYEDGILNPEDDILDPEDNILDPWDDILDSEDDILDPDDIWDPEFGFDEERYLFEFDPITNHIHDDPKYPKGPPSYQKVYTKTEMLSKLLDAWQKRSKENLQEEFSDAEYSDLNVNLYQLEEENRAKLRSFSVRKFLEVIGGQEEVVKFTEKIDQMLIFTKKVLTSILTGCLPMDLPYPALRNILSHMIGEEGLHKVGYMSSDDEVEKVDERFHLHFIEDCIMYFYLYMQKLMFNSSSLPVPNSVGYMRSMIKRFGKHFNELRVLGEKTDSGEKVGQIVTSESGLVIKPEQRKCCYLPS